MTRILRQTTAKNGHTETFYDHPAMIWFEAEKLRVAIRDARYSHKEVRGLRKQLSDIVHGPLCAFASLRGKR